MGDEIKVIPATQIPAMRIRCTVAFGNDGRGADFEIYPDATVSKEELDDRLDTIYAALDRQKAKYEIPQGELVLANAERGLKLAMEELVRFNAKLDARSADRPRGTAGNLAQNDLDQQKGFAFRVEELREQIRFHKGKLAQLRHIVAGEEPLAEAAE